jgi:hypothetical protein
MVKMTGTGVVARDRVHRRQLTGAISELEHQGEFSERGAHTMGQPQRVISLGSLPRDPDRDAALVDVRHPERGRDEIVLGEGLQRKLDRIEEEFRARGSLAKMGLSPKSRIVPARVRLSADTHGWHAEAA